MKPRPLSVDLVILALLGALIWVVLANARPPAARGIESTAAVSAADSTGISTTAVQDAATATRATKHASNPEKGLNKAADGATSTTPASPAPVYATPQVPFSVINADARAALVNILCVANGNTLQPISGSGVLIDPRGIVLTNAHVAQYVLLSEVQQLDLRCSIRTGSPARGSWIPEVLYIPPVWIREHASELTAPHPLGTGEHDYALLYIAGTTDGSSLPAVFPYVSPDPREDAVPTGASVLAASYPAEFLGSSVATALSAATTITSIRQQLTFSTSSVDAISVGGVIEAQSGSSGGAIVNAWDRLIGIITTTSVGTTTSDRDLRAVTLSYINRDLVAQTGKSLEGLLAGDPGQITFQFTRTQAQPLAQLLADQLEH